MARSDSDDPRALAARASSFSRCAFCSRPEGCQTFSRTAASKNKGGGAPKGANHRAAPHSRMLPSKSASGAARATNDSLTRTIRFGRARLPALHRGSRRRANANDSTQAALHANRRERALPAPLSALKPSTWLAGLKMPAGTMPGPPECGVTSPARGNRSRSINRPSPVDVPWSSEMGSLYFVPRRVTRKFHRQELSL